jgi:hypothetical protein
MKTFSGTKVKPFFVKTIQIFDNDNHFVREIFVEQVIESFQERPFKYEKQPEFIYDVSTT